MRESVLRGALQTLERQRVWARVGEEEVPGVAGATAGGAEAEVVGKGRQSRLWAVPD